MTTDKKLEEIDREFDWAFDIFRHSTPPACHGRLSKLKQTVFSHIETLQQEIDEFNHAHAEAKDAIEGYRKTIIKLNSQVASLERVREAGEWMWQRIITTGNIPSKEWDKEWIEETARHEREHPKEAT